MGRLDGKVAFITGAARGQGRSHALRLAQEGADIIAVDIAAQIDTVRYPLASPDDLAETARQVEALDRRIVTAIADVRDYDALSSAVERGVSELGRLDIVCANAGIFSNRTVDDLSNQEWNDMIDVNLTGVWYTAKAAIAHLRAAGGGSIIITSSTAGVKGFPNFVHYVAAKHGVVGIMKTLANELGPDSIRVNTVHPTSVDTGMVQNQDMYDLFAPELPPGTATRELFGERTQALNALPIPWVQPVDISNAVVWLASDEAKYVTGIQLPVDAGSLGR